MENPTLTTLVDTFCRRIKELEKLADSYRKEAIDLQKDMRAFADSAPTGAMIIKT